MRLEFDVQLHRCNGKVCKYIQLFFVSLGLIRALRIGTGGKLYSVYHLTCNL